MTEKKTSIQRAIDRLLLKLSHYEINSLGKVIRKIKRRNNEKGD